MGPSGSLRAPCRSRFGVPRGFWGSGFPFTRPLLPPPPFGRGVPLSRGFAPERRSAAPLCRTVWAALLPPRRRFAADLGSIPPHSPLFLGGVFWGPDPRVLRFAAPPSNPPPPPPCRPARLGPAELRPHSGRLQRQSAPPAPHLRPFGSPPVAGGGVAGLRCVAARDRRRGGAERCQAPPCRRSSGPQPGGRRRLRVLLPPRRGSGWGVAVTPPCAPIRSSRSPIQVPLTPPSLSRPPQSPHGVPPPPSHTLLSPPRTP